MSTNLSIESASDDTPAIRILLVEDNDAACQALTKILQSQGYFVSSASRGHAAIHAMKVDESYDFLLTDLQLPDMDGLEVAEFAGSLRPRPQIGAITGWDCEVSTPLSPECPIDWIMQKPVGIKELLAKLSTPRIVNLAVGENPNRHDQSQDDLERIGKVG